MVEDYDIKYKNKIILIIILNVIGLFLIIIFALSTIIYHIETNYLDVFNY